jgi:hypothetical protein
MHHSHEPEFVADALQRVSAGQIQISTYPEKGLRRTNH